MTSRPFNNPVDKTDEWDNRSYKQAFIRPELEEFATAMELKLRKNDHKKGWRELPVEALFKFLMIEIEEFKVAQEFFGPEEAAKELVDVANFCMMLRDRLLHEKQSVST